MRARSARLLPSAALAFWLALFGLPTAPPLSFIGSADAQSPAGAAADGTVRSTTASVVIDPIGKQTRGTQGVVLRASTGLPHLICRLNVKYRDGESDSPDDVLADASGVCSIHFDVADRRSAVGTANARLKVVTSNGVTKGKASRSFSVK
jgi:hypothetical protein